MQIHAQNLPLRNDLWGNVKLLQKEREILLGRMEIDGGRGILQIKDLEEFCEDWEMWTLKIELTPAGNIWCNLGTCMGEEAVQKELLEISEQEPDGRDVMTAGEKRDEDGCELISAGEKRDADGYEPISVEEKRDADGYESISARGNGTADKTCLAPARMKRDKWQQLCAQLPHIHPFQDEREYLQLNLQDLLILSAKYYRLVENSFLLHGFYNYEHLILTRSRRRGGEKYYLGVPGNYYEREKQVAVWFGFESFETKAEPASEGDFGYYMISVDI